jgi:hypothetical protein
VSEPIGAVLESLLGDGLALALAELKADSAEGLELAQALFAVLVCTRRASSSATMNCG